MRKNCRSIKIKNLKRRDFWLNSMVNRLEDAEALVSSLIAAGYSIYDVAAESGFANLAGKTPGKWLCIWQTGAPTGTYAIQASYITPHTDVQVVGVRLTLLYQVSAHSLAVNIQFSSTSDFTNKLTFQYCTITLTSSSGTYSNFKYLNNFIKFTNVTVTPVFTNIELQNNRLQSNGGYAVFTYSSVVTIKNNYCEHDTGSVIDFISSTADITIENTLFENTEAAAGYYFKFESNNIEFKNTGIKGGSVGVSVLFTTLPLSSNNIIYVDNVQVQLGSNIKAIKFSQMFKGQVFYTGKHALVASYLTSTTGFIKTDAVYTPGRRSIRGLGVITRNTLSVAFQQYFGIDDDVKQIDDDDIWLEWRYDIEADFTTALIAKIANYRFYRTDGTTEVTTFKNPESFLILATRDSAPTEYAVFAWYKGELVPTVFSDIYRNEAYTVVRVFNIWEMPESTDVRNYIYMTDSPLEGSLLLQDFTSRVVR